MRAHVVTLFPEFFTGPLALSILGRAVERGVAHVTCTNPRDFATDRHRTVDDTPYGGGPGMILKAPVLVDAVESLVGAGNPRRVPVILLTPQGEPFTQARAAAWARTPEFVLVCGRYKGIDERFKDLLVTDQISIGDFVLSGGEPAALVMLDAIVRLLPGALGDEDSAAGDSFGIEGQGGLDCTYYTRPPVFRGRAVPPVLMSGHHAKVATWRTHDAATRTQALRPDLVKESPLERGRTQAGGRREPH